MKEGNRGKDRRIKTNRWGMGRSLPSQIRAGQPQERGLVRWWNKKLIS